MWLRKSCVYHKMGYKVNNAVAPDARLELVHMSANVGLVGKLLLLDL